MEKVRKRRQPINCSRVVYSTWVVFFPGVYDQVLPVPVPMDNKGAGEDIDPRRGRTTCVAVVEGF